jgi:hypothetical protein
VALEHEFSYPTKEISYRCIAVRDDQAWGHGLRVILFDQNNKVDVIKFVRHPNYADFETFQQMSTAELIRFAQTTLQSGEQEDSLLEARKAGLQLIFA